MMFDGCNSNMQGSIGGTSFLSKCAPADDWGKRQTHFATETDDMEVGLEPDYSPLP